MGKPVSALLLLLCLGWGWPDPSSAFDLGSLLASLGGGRTSRQCPSQCRCVTRRAELVMQDYATRYLPDMGSHMKPDLPAEVRSIMTAMTSWLGNMADIQCSLSEGERLNLTEVLQASALSFKSIRVTCDLGASIVWDVSAFNALLNVLDISGCEIEKADDSDMLAVPLNLWVLHLEGTPAETAAHLDLSTATQLLFFSFTHSGLASLPESWSEFLLQRLLFVSLAHNDLQGYDCELKTSQLMSLNLDYNSLASVPLCVLSNSRYASHLSMRHNKVENINDLFVNEWQEAAPSEPQLSYLDLAYNTVDSLKVLRKIQRFRGLDLSHNHVILTAADTFSLNPTIDWLDLSNNLLEYVPDGMLSKLVTLTHLNLSYNYLRTFDFDQSPQSTKPVNIDLRHNRLVYPPFADTGYVAPRLSRVVVANNPFTCDCIMNVFLKFLEKQDTSEKRSWLDFGFWDMFGKKPTVSQSFADKKELTCDKPTDLKDAPLSTLSFKENCPLLQGCPKDCKCELIKTGAEHVSVDCSEVKSMTDLPAQLPMVFDTPITLYLNRSGLRRLDHRPYLHLVSELHAGYSKLVSVTPSAMEALQNVSVLDLNHNHLRSLPLVTKNLTMLSATNISLEGNPWTCGCSDLWMPGWISDHAHALYNHDDIRCRWTGKQVTKLSPSDLNCGLFNYLPLAVASSMLLGFSIIVISLLIKYKLEVLVFLYTRFRIRPFDMYKYSQSRPCLFDIFVSFSQQDCRWVVEKLLDQLENRPKPYRLCTHLRDFPIGAPISNSVAWAVANSRCNLLVITRNLIATEWCHPEFRAAHLRLLKERGSKALIIVHGPLDARMLDQDLLAYLKTHNYLRTEDKGFWSKLEYALPRPTDSEDMLRGAAALPNDEDGMPPPPIDLDTLLPIALAAGDVSPKQNGGCPIPSPVEINV